MNQNPQDAAAQLLREAYRRIGLQLPELMSGLVLLRRVACRTPCALQTDGEMLLYHPETLLRSFGGQVDRLCVQLLHLLLHGMLDHLVPFNDIGHFEVEKAYHLAADIQVCAVLRSLLAPADTPAGQLRLLRQQADCQLYDWLEVIWPLPAPQRQALRRQYKVDRHIWLFSPESSARWRGKQQAVQQALDRCLYQALHPYPLELFQNMLSLPYPLPEKDASLLAGPPDYRAIFAQIEARHWDDNPFSTLAVAVDLSQPCGGAAAARFRQELDRLSRIPLPQWANELLFLLFDDRVRDHLIFSRKMPWSPVGIKWQAKGPCADIASVTEWIASLRWREQQVRGLLCLTGTHAVLPAAPPPYPVFLLQYGASGQDPPLPDWVQAYPLDGI